MPKMAPVAPATTPPMVIALAGLLSLAVAMGIGRFAFTPLLPMMLHDGVIDLTGASWMASVNYLGYWIGATACALQPALWQRWRRRLPLSHTAAVRTGLVATVLLTLGMALPLPALWPLWRLLAGMASALVFVYVAGWCLARLTALDAPSLAGIIFVGPGLGIAASGLAASAMVALGLHATTGWAVFALLAAALSAVAWPHLRGAVAPPAAVRAAHTTRPRGSLALFTLAYGLAGFGYIVTATFLPVIARQMLPGSAWQDLFWPLFGIGVALGALLTVRLPLHWDRRHLLMVCYAMMANGVLLSVWLPSLWGFAAGSLLLGLPFTAVTLFAVQEARRLRPHDASAAIGLLTAAFGLGQIAGPPLVALLLAHSATPAQGFAWSLQTAAAALLAGMLLYGWIAWHDRPGASPH